jgi:RNA polymerase sigma-70 factor (ECF subfamily)
MPTPPGRVLTAVLRTDRARLLAGLIRLAGDFEHAEDALQEACARALVAWPRDGMPDQPGAWLNTVARRIALDRLRRDRHVAMVGDIVAEESEPEPDNPSGVEDDRLRLLFTCCHPALAPEARCALALRSLGGLSTREIARAYLISETSAAQRLVRAKQKIRLSRIAYEVPDQTHLPERLASVLQVIYLIFNEGYAATDSADLIRPDLCAEGIRLARLAHALMPAQAEVTGLLALLLLTDARRPARVDPAGDLVLLEQQDRSRWDRAAIAEGSKLLAGAMALRAPGPYQLQAAIAALHAEATSADATDWAQILALYQRLLQYSPSPVVELNAAVALGMAEGPRAGLNWIALLEQRAELLNYHLFWASKADLYRRLGDHQAAARAYAKALALTANAAEQRFLTARMAALQDPATT